MTPGVIKELVWTLGEDLFALRTKPPSAFCPQVANQSEGFGRSPAIAGELSFGLCSPQANKSFRCRRYVLTALRQDICRRRTGNNAAMRHYAGVINLC
jgi:hypothetical protein